MKPVEYGIWIATMGAGGGVAGTALYHERWGTAAAALVVMGLQVYLFWQRQRSG